MPEIEAISLRSSSCFFWLLRVRWREIAHLLSFWGAGVLDCFRDFLCLGVSLQRRTDADVLTCPSTSFFPLRFFLQNVHT